MVRYEADSDIRDIMVGNVPPLDPADQQRVNDFLQLDQQVQLEFQNGTASRDAMHASIVAAQAVYEQRTASLPVGWQKYAVLQAGLLGIEIGATEVMEWAYALCKTNPGWLGNFDEDIDHERPLRAFTQSVPVMALIEFKGSY